MTPATKYLIGAGAVVVVAAGGFLLLRKPQAPVVTPPPVTHPAPASAPAVAPPPPAPPPAPVDCVLPGPAPTPPDGATATADQMKQGHDDIQAFVLKLEGYQACRDAQADHASPLVTDQAKQNWIAEGDAAVDEANALADAFAEQIKVFKAHHPGP